MNDIKDLLELNKIEMSRICDILDYYNSIKNNLSKQNTDLHNMITKRPIIITDHARIRFIERVLKMDMKIIDDKLLTKDLITKYNVLGDMAYDMGEFISVIKNKSIITILNK